MSIIRYEEMSKNHSLPIEDIISSMNAALQETNATAQALVNYFGTKAILKPTEVIPFHQNVNIVPLVLVAMIIIS